MAEDSVPVPVRVPGRDKEEARAPWTDVLVDVAAPPAPVSCTS